jgi:hypothetical protein
MKIFGRKVHKTNLKKLGRKIGHVANVVGRKTLNTIDKAAPIASVAALALGQPEIAAAISAGQGLAHATDGAVRSGVAAGTANKANRDKRLVEFGDNVESLRSQGNDTHALLRR